MVEEGQAGPEGLLRHGRQAMSRGLTFEQRRLLKKRAMVLLKQGLKQMQIRERLGVHSSTMSAWMQEYKKSLTTREKLREVVKYV